MIFYFYPQKVEFVVVSILVRLRFFVFIQTGNYILQCFIALLS